MATEAAHHKAYLTLLNQFLDSVINLL